MAEETIEKLKFRDIKSWTEDDILIHMQKGDAKYPEFVGSDVVNLYGKLDEDFVYLLIERDVPEGKDIKFNYEYQLLSNNMVKPEDKIQFLIAPDGTGVNVWKQIEDGEAESIDTSDENEKFYMESSLGHLYVRIPREALKILEFEDLDDLGFYLSVISLDRKKIDNTQKRM